MSAVPPKNISSESELATFPESQMSAEPADASACEAAWIRYAAWARPRAGGDVVASKPQERRGWWTGTPSGASRLLVRRRTCET